MAENNRDLYQEMTDTIIEMMEQGNLPWQKAWDGKSASAAMGMPVNGFTGRPYTSENKLYLSIIMAKKGSTDPRFYTIKQLRKMTERAREKAELQRQRDIADGKEPTETPTPFYGLRKGARGIGICCSFFVVKDKYGNPLPEKEKHWAKRYVSVFHASDCCWREPQLDRDGEQVYDANGKPQYIEHDFEPYEPKVQPYTHEEQMELAEDMLTRSGAKILHDRADRCSYSPSEDTIHMVSKDWFEKLEEYYSTALHELGHWTGHSSRLDRNISNTFGTPEYAKEELRAEMASVYLSIDLGLPLSEKGMENHAAYVQSWMETLKKDKFEFVKACADAQKIAGYIKNLVKEKLRTEVKETDQPALQPGLLVETISPEMANADPKLFKYYLNAHSALPSTIPENVALVDLDDKGGKYGAVYYDRRLEKTDIEKFELTPDPYHYSNNMTKVTVYLAEKKHPFGLNGSMVNGLEDGEAFAIGKFDDAYHGVQETLIPAKDFSLDSVYDKYNAADKATRNLAVGDLIQVNDRFFCVQPQGFSEVEFTQLGDRSVMVSVPEENVKMAIQSAKEAVGEETYEKYKQNFQRAFLLGSKVKEIPSGKEFFPQSYQKFLYEHAFEHGASSLHPNDKKAWEDLDTAFAQKLICEPSNPEVIPNAVRAEFAAKLIQSNSPFMAVQHDPDYGKRIANKVFESPMCKQIITDREAAKAAAKEEAVARAIA